MKCGRKTLAIVVITFVLATGQGYAHTLSRVLEDRLFSGVIGDSRLIYGGYAMDTKQFQFAYAEHDEFANGYGAFTLQTASQDYGRNLSFIALKESGNGELGMGIYRAPETMDLELGLSFGYDPIRLRACVHMVALNQRNEHRNQTSVSVGGSVKITRAIALGVDARSGDQWNYDLHSSIRLTSELTTRVSVACEESKWQDAKMEFWYNHKQLLLHLGYTLSDDPKKDLRFGMGFRF